MTGAGSVGASLSPSLDCQWARSAAFG